MSAFAPDLLEMMPLPRIVGRDVRKEGASRAQRERSNPRHRWFFAFDGWRSAYADDGFVLA
jgi:hypothetical protein